MPEPVKTGGLKLKKAYYDSQAQQEPAPDVNGAASPSTVASLTPFHRKQDNSHKIRQNLLTAASWVIFIALGGALAYFRFVAPCPWLTPEEYKQYGLMAIAVIYVISILFALKDSMFAGLMAIVVPFYPIYYLLNACSAVLFRAVGAAFLAAFGYDALVLIQKYATIAYDKISYWIQNV